MASSEARRIGCLYLFLGPLIIGGVVILAYGITQFNQGKMSREALLPLVLVSGMFTLIFGAMLPWLHRTIRNSERIARCQVALPDEPWRWREDWAAGTIRCAVPGGLFVFWFFGVVFGGAGVVILSNLEDILRDGPIAYAFLLFPLIGGAMLITAIYMTLRWVKYGRSACNLETNPAVPGGEFRAVVRARLALVPGTEVVAALTSYHVYVTGTGKSRQIHRVVQWQESSAIQADKLSVVFGDYVEIPVAFQIPADAAPSTPGAPSDRIEWELSLTAELPGIDFRVDFIVPVSQ